MKRKLLLGFLALALWAPCIRNYVFSQDPKGAGKPHIAETATISPECRESLLTEIQRAEKLLQDGDVETFVDDYFPLDELRRLRNERRTSADAANFLKQNPRSLKYLREILQQARTGLWNGTSDEVAISDIPKPEPAAPKPDKLVQAPSTEGVKGYGGEFPQVLKTWIADLKAKRYSQFLTAALPASEVARIEAAGEVEAITQVFEVHPEAAQAMLADLEAVARLNPEPNGNLIKVMLPGRLGDDPDREIRFQKLGDHWRFYDQTSEVQATLYPILNGEVKVAVSTPETTTLLTFERIREHWRIRQLPPPPASENR